MKRAKALSRRERTAAQPAPESETFYVKMAGREVIVPYVAAWSSEFPEVRVAPEPLMGGTLALFRGTGRRGEGKPVLGKMDMGRQRRCILRGLCQVCARPIQGPRWLALLEEPIDLQGMPVRAVREPAACTACMALSLAVCPGLGRTRPWVVEPDKTITLITKTTPPIGGVGELRPDGPELVDARHRERSRRAGAAPCARARGGGRAGDVRPRHARAPCAP